MASDTASIGGGFQQAAPVWPGLVGRTVRIGGASGFWGDSAIATPQLLQVPGLHYLVYDYLAETTMAILARAKAKRPELGYATDFVQAVVKPHLATALAQGVRLVANAGGLNPQACAQAVAAVAREQGLSLTIAVVHGDDLLGNFQALCDDGAVQWLEPEPMPGQPWSANAYTGAQAIAKALDLGADVVMTGRCVDSAVVVGVLAHEFGWDWPSRPESAGAMDQADGASDWDRLARATLAGHVIECGAQATGGLFTDWELVADWSNIGYPVIDCDAQARFVVHKAEQTGGLIHPAAVAEQVLYEIGDPSAYLMPDVRCDFRQVQVAWADEQRRGVLVTGAQGLPPTATLKGNLTWHDGYQLQLMGAIRGIDARAKAEKTADALLERSRRLMAQAGFDDYQQVTVEYLGCESHYGPHAHVLPTREVVLRIAARHASDKALKFLQLEAASPGTSMAAGTRSTFSGRPDIQPVIKVGSFLIDKVLVPLKVDVVRLDAQCDDGSSSGKAAPRQSVTAAAGVRVDSDAYHTALGDHSDLVKQCVVCDASIAFGLEQAPPRTRTVPLVELAWARSGDKGDSENIGVIARHPSLFPVLQQQLTADRVADYFAHLVKGEVTRFELPGLDAFNVLMTQALDGGGVRSLRSDPLGKSYAQMLLDLPIEVPEQLYLHLRSSSSSLSHRIDQYA